ncbi:hypothetical protein IC761_01575 [Bradyrhizobium commune]|uniref:Uncharacterized protein n=1 Tax=Bradyrhizobium commune TaxID=83627 RepID=A0A7S9D6E2_9BRAD|nr:hypothetical protein IC761_01575 [Bradyrhizobium commune]
MRIQTQVAIASHGIIRFVCDIRDPTAEIASVAGFGVSGPLGPRDGISSGVWPGNSSGRGGEPGSRTGGAMSGCGLPGGMPGGGSVGVPGVAGGISGGSIGIRHHRDQLSGERQR